MGQRLGSTLVSLIPTWWDVGRQAVMKLVPKRRVLLGRCWDPGVTWVWVWLCSQLCMHTSARRPSPLLPAGWRGDGDLITASAKAP